MKVLCINGSPRMEGNTNTVAKWVEDELRNLGHQVDHIDIVEEEIHGCLACWTCVKHKDAPGCAQVDDAGDIFLKIIDSDLIIIAFPLYCWGFPGPLKSLIDRHISLVSGYMSPEHDSLVKGKRLAFVCTMGGPVENNADIVQVVIQRMARFTMYQHVGNLMIPFAPSHPSDLNPEIKTQATQFANTIAS